MELHVEMSDFGIKVLLNGVKPIVKIKKKNNVFVLSGDECLKLDITNDATRLTTMENQRKNICLVNVSGGFVHFRRYQHAQGLLVRNLDKYLLNDIIINSKQFEKCLKNIQEYVTLVQENETIIGLMYKAHAYAYFKLQAKTGIYDVNELSLIISCYESKVIKQFERLLKATKNYDESKVIKQFERLVKVTKS